MRVGSNAGREFRELSRDGILEISGTGLMWIRPLLLNHDQVPGIGWN